jgi:hypothetical protein
MISREEIKKIFKEIHPDADYSFQVESVSFAKYIADIAYNRAIDDAVILIYPKNQEFDWTEYAKIRAHAATEIRALKDHQRSE